VEKESNTNVNKDSLSDMIKERDQVSSFMQSFRYSPKEDIYLMSYILADF